MYRLCRHRPASADLTECGEWCGGWARTNPMPAMDRHPASTLVEAGTEALIRSHKRVSSTASSDKEKDDTASKRLTQA